MSCQLELRNPQGHVTRVFDGEAQGSAAIGRRGDVRVVGDEIAVGIGHPGLDPHGEAGRLAVSTLTKPFLVGLERKGRVRHSNTDDEDSYRAKHADQ